MKTSILVNIIVAANSCRRDLPTALSDPPVAHKVTDR